MSNNVVTLTRLFKVIENNTILYTYTSSSTRMRVMNHKWSDTIQRHTLHSTSL